MSRGGTRGKLKSGVRAFHQGAPTVADLEQAGLTLDSDEITIPNPDGWFYDTAEKQWKCVVWPENWPAVRFYTRWHGQWRVVSGPSGIHYVAFDMPAMLSLLELEGIPRDADMLGCLRVIESEARKHLNAA